MFAGINVRVETICSRGLIFAIVSGVDNDLGTWIMFVDAFIFAI